MEAELVACGVAADLQHLAGGYCQRGTPALIERIAIRHEHAERVVAAAEIEHDEIPERRALRERDIGEKARRRETQGERADAAADEMRVW